MLVNMEPAKKEKAARDNIGGAPPYSSPRAGALDAALASPECTGSLHWPKASEPV